MKRLIIFGLLIGCAALLMTQKSNIQGSDEPNPESTEMATVPNSKSPEVVESASEESKETQKSDLDIIKEKIAEFQIEVQKLNDELANMGFPEILNNEALADDDRANIINQFKVYSQKYSQLHKLRVKRIRMEARL